MTGGTGGAGQKLAVLSLLTLAAWVRIDGIDLGWFMFDQVRDAEKALRIAHGQEFPAVGPVVAGQFLAMGPLYYYLLAIPYSISRDPVVGVGFLLALHIIAIYLTYRLGMELCGLFAGLTAAALFAVFPMAAISGMALWNPGFVPFFSVSFMYALCRYVISRQPWWLVGTAGSLAALLQIHLSGCIFAVMLLAAVVLFQPPLALQPLTCAALLGLTLYAPYLHFEWQRGFQDLWDMFAFIQDNWTAGPAQSAITVMGRALAAPFLLPEQFASGVAEDVSPPFFAAVQRVELVLFGLALVYLLYALIRQPGRRALVLLALWVVLPLVLLSRKSGGLLWYYFDVLYPVQFLLIGLLLSALMARTARMSPTQSQSRVWLVGTAILLVGGISASQGWFLKRYQSAVGQAGVLRFPTTISVGNRHPWGPPEGRGARELLETMPVRFKKALTAQLVSGFHVGQAAYERNVHGVPFLSLREDKGYYFTWLSRRDRMAPADPGLHYLILRDDLHAAVVEWAETSWVGPYRIVAYRPWIREGSWRYHLAPLRGWNGFEFDDSDWNEVMLPARARPDLAAYADTPFYTWGGPNVSLRGWIDVPDGEARFRLVVSFRGDFTTLHRVAAMYVNGRRVPAAHTTAYKTVLARHSETSFDLTEALAPGANLVALQIVEGDPDVGPLADPAGGAGGPRAFDLDVYEFRR